MAKTKTLKTIESTLLARVTGGATEGSTNYVYTIYAQPNSKTGNGGTGIGPIPINPGGPGGGG